MPELPDQPDHIEGRLRRAATAWQHDQSPALRVDPTSLTRRRGRRVALGAGIAVAAAAVVAVAVGVSALPRHDDGRDAPSTGFQTTPTTTSAPAPEAPVVPWKGLPPTYPNVGHQVPVSLDTLAAQAARHCSADDLVATATGDGAGGTEYVSVALTPRSATPCSVDGFPRVTTQADGSTVVAKRVRYTRATGEVDGRVLASREKPAYLQLSFPDGTGCGGTQPTGGPAEITIGSGTLDVPGIEVTPTCSADTFFNATRFLPYETVHPEQRTVTPFDDVVATGSGLDQRVEQGGTAHFRITLTAPKDTSLKVCPDYRVMIGRVNGSVGLNCAGVSYRDDAGDPYLPAGTPVTFQMDISVPPRLTGEQKLLWTLDGPTSAPGANGVLTITG